MLAFLVRHVLSMYSAVTLLPLSDVFVNLTDQNFNAVSLLGVSICLPFLISTSSIFNRCEILPAAVEPRSNFLISNDCFTQLRATLTNDVLANFCISFSNFYRSGVPENAGFCMRMKRRKRKCIRLVFCFSMDDVRDRWKKYSENGIN